MQDLINKLIRRDLEKSTGIDWAGTHDFLMGFLDRCLWLRFFMPAYDQLHYEELSLKFQEIYKKYFYWDEKSGKEPIELYIYAYENWNDILNELTEGLPEEMLEGAIGYMARVNIENGFKDLPSMLLKIASVHKFNIDYVRERIFVDEAEKD